MRALTRRVLSPFGTRNQVRIMGRPSKPCWMPRCGSNAGGTKTTRSARARLAAPWRPAPEARKLTSNLREIAWGLGSTLGAHHRGDRQNPKAAMTLQQHSLPLPFSLKQDWKLLVSFFVVMCALATSLHLEMTQLQQNRDLLGHFDFGEERFENYTRVRKEFRPRIGSTSLVRLFHTTNDRVMRERIAIHFALGFVALSLVYLMIDLRSAFFLMLGSFASIEYMLLNPAWGWSWMPWDMPAVFWSALALLFALRRSRWGLLITVLAGVVFKETIIVMGLFFLFFDTFSVRQRVAWAAVAIGLAYGIRLGIEYAVSNPMFWEAYSYQLYGRKDTDFRWQANLKYIFSLRMHHFVWVNLGTLLLVYLLPTQDAILRGFKFILICFCFGLFFAGTMAENRIFLEALPGSLLILSETIRARSVKGSTDTRAEELRWFTGPNRFF